MEQNPGAKFKLGIEPFDGEHQAMMNVIAKMSKAALNPLDKAAAAALVGELASLAERHFNNEETELEKRGYPELVEHEDEHRNLLNELKEIRTRIESGEAAMNEELADFLYNWMAVHVTETDAKYRRLFP